MCAALVLVGGSAIGLWWQRTPGDAPAPVALHVNPNTATAAELKLLPNIGPARARRIIEYRDECPTPPAFRTAEDLAAVPSIGPRTVEDLRVYLDLPAGPAQDTAHTGEPLP